MREEIFDLKLRCCVYVIGLNCLIAYDLGLGEGERIHCIQVKFRTFKSFIHFYSSSLGQKRSVRFNSCHLEVSEYFICKIWQN